MDEPEAQPPQAEKSLTRADVLRLIEEHGGPNFLDLRDTDLRQADLSGLDLQGAYLSRANLQGMHLWQAQFEGADFRGANLEGTNLLLANLRRAYLFEAHLERAQLFQVDLQGAYLFQANLHQASLLETNLRGAYLTGANLQGAILWQPNLEGARLFEADLQRSFLFQPNLRQASLRGAKLQEADLREANLEEADLSEANLQQADARRADLRRASLAYANLRDANLEGANWGDYVLGEEIDGNFGRAAPAYRALKQRHTETGMYDVAGEFHYREMEARRKLGWKERRFPYVLAMYALRFLYGYGERPERVIGWAAAVVFGLALVHWAFGTVAGGFLDALYYSAVSFPALGYGHWAPEPQGWAGRFLGAGESFMGVFMIALFLVTFTRKMTR